VENSPLANASDLDGCEFRRFLNSLYYMT
jgi:hypothetical protein